MKHPAHMYSTKQIADNCGQSHEDTKKLLAKLGFKPLREVKTGDTGRMYRYWHKDALNALLAHLEERRKEKEAPIEPVQASLPLESLEDAVEVAKEIADKMRVIPDTRIDLRETLEESRARSDEMLSVLRSIDDRLGTLVAIWSK